jgi:hypothetical protein
MEPQGYVMARQPAPHDRFRPDNARLQRRILGLLNLALVALGGLILASWAFLAAVHLRDRYAVGHGQGVWMALAQHLNTQGLYPELYDGQAYGGSRYMPAPIVLHAALARITGDYLVAGKLVGFLVTLLLVILVFLVLRSMDCPPPVAIALSAAVVGSHAGLLAGTTIGGDPLPVLLQVAALALVARSTRASASVWAAALAACAVLSKSSALWAPAAIAVWLAAVDRRRLKAFAVAFPAITLALVTLATVVSEGRLLENLVGLSGAGIQGPAALVTSPFRLLWDVVRLEPGTWALLPLAVSGALFARSADDISIYHVGLAAALCILVVVYADIGTGPNQLIDLVVPTVLCVGQLAGRTAWRAGQVARVAAIIALTLVLTSLSALTVTLREPLQDAIRTVATGRSSYPRDPLAGKLTAGMKVLSEDPGVLVRLGRPPVVYDPFMLPRIEQRSPAAVRDLVRRIDAQEFDLIVLVVPLEPTSNPWWRDYHLGQTVVAAVDRAYDFAEQVGGYYLYRPAR